MEANKVSFAYVAGLYSTIKDSDVKVTDAEILAYMKKNEKKFKAEETREVEYVLIADEASKEMRLDKERIRILSGSVVYNQETGKNDTLGFKTTKTQLNL
jgi:peptidyl-prolyl cis-trans isomerase D